MIPTAAVQRGAPGTFVYLVKPDNTVAHARRSRSARQTASSVAVTHGLAPGDKVVVDGADQLRDGAKVTLPRHGRRRPRSPRPAKARAPQRRQCAPRTGSANTGAAPAGAQDRAAPAGSTMSPARQAAPRAAQRRPRAT